MLPKFQNRCRAMSCYAYLKQCFAQMLDEYSGNWVASLISCQSISLSSLKLVQCEQIHSCVGTGEIRVVSVDKKFFVWNSKKRQSWSFLGTASDKALVTGGGWRSSPVSKHLVQSFLPFIGETCCELVGFWIFWVASSPHFRFGCFRRRIKRDHLTVIIIRQCL